jgi:hypothetical protein
LRAHRHSPILADGGAATTHASTLATAGWSLRFPRLAGRGLHRNVTLLEIPLMQELFGSWSWEAPDEARRAPVWADPLGTDHAVALALFGDDDEEEALDEDDVDFDDDDDLDDEDDDDDDLDDDLDDEDEDDDEDDDDDLDDDEDDLFEDLDDEFDVDDDEDDRPGRPVDED